MCMPAPQALCLSSVSFSVCLLFLEYDLVMLKHSFPPSPSHYGLACHEVGPLGAYTSTPILKVLFHSCSKCFALLLVLSLLPLQQLGVVGLSFFPDCAAALSLSPPFLPQIGQASPSSFPRGCGLGAYAWDVCVNVHDSEYLCLLCVSY